MSGNSQSVFNPGYVLKNGKIKLVTRTSPLQIDNESDLEEPALQALPPTSIAHLPGWSKAWQKDNDGVWQPMIGGE